MIKLLPEWVKQSGVMLTWPNANYPWKSPLHAIETIFVELTKQIALREKVLISGCSDEHCRHIALLLKNASVNMAAIKIVPVPAREIWARDHGPITIIDENQAYLLDFEFNSWGNKYPSQIDNTINSNLHRLKVFQDIKMKSVDFVLEGGSIETDGEGTLLTTSRCLLAETRNPHLTKTELENFLKQQLGLHRILWLNHGYMAGDDTDGHIDTLARFTDPHTICYMHCADPNDEHYAELTAMELELKSFRDYQGNPYRLQPLPWPKPIYSQHGERLPNTYANFLIINEAVLVPIYGNDTDEAAIACLKSCFPTREIIGIPCRDLIAHYGSLHCVTMQLPTGVPL